MTTDNTQPTLEVARSLKNEHKLKKALKTCNAVIAASPKLAEAHQLRGAILVELDRKSEALAAFQEALRLKPNLAGAKESLRSLPSGLKPADAGPLHETGSLPPIAGFWRRLIAFLIDGLFLAVVELLLGQMFAPFWYQIGPYGRVVSLLLVLPYFTLLNSKVGGGQTLGKRLLGIAVRDADNNPISLGRSLLRISILALPSILNGWAIDVLQLNVIAWLVTFVTFSIVGVTSYMLLFNPSMRQGLHDLICRTYVVNLRSDRRPALPARARIHWIISGAIVIAAVIYATAISFIPAPDFTQDAAFRQISKLHQTLQDDSRFFSVNVRDGTTSSSSGVLTSHYLQIQFWYKGVPSQEEQTKIVNDTAKNVLTNADNPDQYDTLEIDVVSSFNLGIAQGSDVYPSTASIKEWRQKTGLTGSP